MPVAVHSVKVFAKIYITVYVYAERDHSCIKHSISMPEDTGTSLYNNIGLLEYWSHSINYLQSNYTYMYTYKNGHFHRK